MAQSLQLKDLANLGFKGDVNIKFVVDISTQGTILSLGFDKKLFLFDLLAKKSHSLEKLTEFEK
jgi:hypothetical protein